MPPPTLSPEDVEAALPGVTIHGSCVLGGQKLVFRCRIDGRDFALKVIGVSSAADADAILARAEREVGILGKCQSPHLVKLGPVPLQPMTISGAQCLIYSEQWIDGESIRETIAGGKVLSIAELKGLAAAALEAIEEIWSYGCVHRDIKPENVIHQTGLDDYVLLDLGYALDLAASSLSGMGAVAGTLQYWSPEQSDPARKRSLDFRSDFFALGTTLYEAATGYHPFIAPGDSISKAIMSILHTHPAPARTHRTELPPEFEMFVATLLAKKPHLRYRTFDRAREALAAIPQ